MIRFLIVSGEGGGGIFGRQQNTGTGTGTVLYKEQYPDGEDGDPDDGIEREGPLVFRS